MAELMAKCSDDSGGSDDDCADTDNVISAETGQPSGMTCQQAWDAAKQFLGPDSPCLGSLLEQCPVTCGTCTPVDTAEDLYIDLLVYDTSAATTMLTGDDFISSLTLPDDVTIVGLTVSDPNTDTPTQEPTKEPTKEPTDSPTDPGEDVPVT
eukprot:UN00931